jgi:hypothetical protein
MVDHSSRTEMCKPESVSSPMEADAPTNEYSPTAAGCECRQHGNVPPIVMSRVSENITVILESGVKMGVFTARWV